MMRRLSVRRRLADNDAHRSRKHSDERNVEWPVKVFAVGVLLLLAACDRHPSSAPSRAQDGSVATVSVDARVEAIADANVDDASAESPLQDIFNQKASAPIAYPAKHEDVRELPLDEQGYGFGRASGLPLGPKPPMQGGLGHGGKYRHDAGATP
jgi:hypothetical protein